MVRDGAVVAWVVPNNVSATTAFRIVGAHTDSPCFVLKPSPASRTADGWGQLEVEVYGGMLRNSWLDRELAIAGRLVTADGTAHLVRTGALARIPQLAIHLDRAINSEGLTLDPQKHLHPVWYVGDEVDLLQRLALDAGLESSDSTPNQIVAFDLCLIPAQGAGVFGAHNEFVAAGRQDNLSSVHAGLCALERITHHSTGSDTCEPRSGHDILAFACFDHEEVGSETRTGAAGPLLADVLTRTASALGRDSDQMARMFAASSCVSADAAHSVHPNYVERHDPTHHPVMGSGPVLKMNANQRYATDGCGKSLWLRACAAAGVESQEFVSNNSVPCGSTIGPITATRLGIRTVDVGVPLLSMHSAREMSHAKDIRDLSLVLEAYWQGA